jgi:hypothetical protein
MGSPGPGSMSYWPGTGETIRQLPELNPTTLAVMHGSCFNGDATKTLLALADNYDTRHHAARG